MLDAGYWILDTGCWILDEWIADFFSFRLKSVLRIAPVGLRTSPHSEIRIPKSEIEYDEYGEIFDCIESHNWRGLFWRFWLV